MIHDENKDLKLLAKVVKIDFSNKRIIIKNNQVIGNRRWGRIDFLCHYCGWSVVKEDGVILNNSDSSERQDKRKKKEVLKKKSTRKMMA